MALNETQTVRISEILEVDPDLITMHLASGMVVITTAKELAIEAQMALWEAGPATVTEWAKLHPKEANKGVETDPDRDASKIRAAIAYLLGRPDWANSSSAMEFELVRG